MFGSNPERGLAKRIWKSGRAVSMAQGMFARQAPKANAQLEYDLYSFLQHFNFEDSTNKGDVNFKLALRPFVASVLYDIRHPANGSVEVSSLVAEACIHLWSSHGVSEVYQTNLRMFMQLTAGKILTSGVRTIELDERDRLIDEVLELVEHSTQDLVTDYISDKALQAFSPGVYRVNEKADFRVLPNGEVVVFKEFGHDLSDYLFFESILEVCTHYDFSEQDVVQL